MKMLILLALSALVCLAHAGNNTVTDEVWFEFEIKDLDGPGVDYRGRVKIALFGEAAPITVLNFKSIARGYKRGRDSFSYKNNVVHRVVPDFVMQMGDITSGDGTGGTSIYGTTFDDEPFILSHRSAGWLAMANHGANTNGSQFYITLQKARWLDGNHVVFGKVIRGFEVLKTIGEVPTDKATAIPKKRIRVLDCGVSDLEAKYDMDDASMDSNEDLD